MKYIYFVLFIIACCCSQLSAQNSPSSLLDFKALDQAEHHLIKWAINSDMLHDYYTLYYSLNGLQFDSLSTFYPITANGLVAHYQHQHAHTTDATAYYQLHIKSVTNNQSVSQIIELNQTPAALPLPQMLSTVQIPIQQNDIDTIGLTIHPVLEQYGLSKILPSYSMAKFW